MQKRNLWRSIRGILLLAGIVLAGGATTVFATDSSSSHYQITESQFSGGSNQDSCSQAYCARVTIGDTSDPAPKQSSSSFTATTQDSTPILELIIDPGQSDLGTLTSEHTATKTTTIRINTYLSGGYILQIIGDPPKFSGHTLNALATPTASQPGTEQFGMNLAANTTPSVGAAPVQVPDNGTIFGTANDDYKTPNLFKYLSGDVVAHSLTDSGHTDYTLSMLVNISNATPAGHYSGDFSAVVMPAY